MNSFQQPGPPQQGWPQNNDVSSLKQPLQQSQGWPQQPPQQHPGMFNGNPQNNVKTIHYSQFTITFYHLPFTVA